jgi:hypothetical protein
MMIGLIFFTLFSPVMGQFNAKPILSVEKTTQNFGTIPEGTVVTQVYTFTNTGDAPLQLTEAEASCGCTVPAWPREAIAPGETASLTVVFDATNKRGKRQQRVTITANTEPAQTHLYLVGEVIYPAEATLASPTTKVSTPMTELGPDCLAVYPNPTMELLRLEMDKNNYGSPAEVTILAPTGQIMARRTIPELRGIIEFNVGHYPAGSYVARVRVGDRVPEARCFIVAD